MERVTSKESAPKEKSATSAQSQKPSCNEKSNVREETTVSSGPSKSGAYVKKPNSQVVHSISRDDALLETRAIARALMNAPEDAVVILDSEGRVLDANATACRGLGTSRRSLIGHLVWGFLPPHVARGREAAFQEACRTSAPVRYEDKREWRCFDNVIYPVVELNGKIRKWVVIARDITDRKKVDEILRDRDERFRIVVERTSDMVGIATFSAQPYYLYVNPSYHTVLGHKPEDLIGKNPLDLLHPEDRERLTSLLNKYLNDKAQGLLFRDGKAPSERILYRLLDAFGNWRYLEGTANLMGEDHILMVSRDVSERIKSEQDLKSAQHELESEVEERARELKVKSESLEDTNTALKVLLEMRDQDRKELERTVLFNVRQLSEPYLEKLKNSGLNETQTRYLDILRSNLQELVSPISKDLVLNGADLTPSQVRITNLIRFGKSSKEIAEALNVSIKTVETHRRKIRAKLGLNKTKTNLRSYLQGYKTSHRE